MPFNSVSDSIDILIRAKADAAEITKMDAATKSLIDTMGKLTTAVNTNTEAFKKQTEAAGKGLDEFTKKLNSIISNPAFSVNSPWSIAGRAVQQLATSLGTVGVVSVASAVGVGILVKGVSDLVSNAAQGARELQNFATRLDISTGTALKLSISAQIAGVNLKTLEQSARLLGNAIDDGAGSGKKQVDALRELGIATFNASGEQRAMGDVLNDVIGNLAGVSNAAERAHLGQVLLGRGSKELIPLIDQYKELKEISDKVAAGLDVGVNEELVKAAKATSELDAALTILKRNLASNFAPAYIKFVQIFSSAIENKANTPREINGSLFGDAIGSGADGIARPRTPGVPTQADLSGIFNEAAQRVGFGDAFRKKDDLTKEGLTASLKQAESEINQFRAQLRSGDLDKEGQASVGLKLDLATQNRDKAQAGLDGLREGKKLATELANELERAQKALTLAQGKDAGPLGKIFADQKADLEQAAKFHSDALDNLINQKAFVLELDAIEKIRTTNAKELTKEGNAYLKLVQDQTNESLRFKDQQFTLGLTRSITGDTRDLTKLKEGRDQISGDSTDALRLQFAKSQQIDTLSFGAGGQVSAINKAYQDRLNLAQQILDIKVHDADFDKSIALTDAQLEQAELERKKAIRDFDKETDQAHFDALIKYAEYQQKQLDDYKSSAGKIFDAITASGSGGLASFFQGQLKTIERQLFVNVAGETFKGAQGLGIGNIIGGQTGADGKPSLVGRLLAGTPFAKQDKLADFASRTAVATETIAAQVTGVGGVPLGGSGVGSFPGLGTIPGLGGLFSAVEGGGTGFTGNKTFGGSSVSSSGGGSGLSGLFSGLGRSTDLKGIFTGIGGSSNNEHAFSTSERVGAGIGAAGIAIGAISGAVSGFSKGGGRGIASGIGSLAGGAAALDPEPISKAILGGVALAAGVVTALFGDPKQARANAESSYISGHSVNNQYTTNADGTLSLNSNYQGAPTSRDYDISGNQVDYSGSNGATRVIIQAPINVSTMDAQSFMDNSDKITNAVQAQVALNHPLVDTFRQINAS